MAPAAPAADQDEGKGGAASMVSGLSQYLLKNCTPWQEAPPCPDYVGPVVVARTPDGRGRGLFATEDVPTGTLLLISNPLSLTYDDPHRISLLAKLVSDAQKDPLLLKRIYTLAHTQSSQHQLEVPSMDFLTSDSSEYASGEECAPIDPKKIMDIIMLNSFEGEYQNEAHDDSTWFCGLYLIPSLINHSCHRNASRLIIGGAMLVHAARDIRKGEEITITYVSTVAPLRRRQKSSLAMKFGFTCKCKRCILEESLENSLGDMSELYCSLHDKATEEVHVAMHSHRFPPPDSSYPAVTQLRNVYDIVRERVYAQNGLSELERNWVLAGYSSAYLGKWLVIGYTTFFSDAPALLDPKVVDVIKALRTTVPGLVHTLSLATFIVGITQREENKDEIAKEVFTLGMAECAGAYGNQESDGMLKLMESSMHVIPFF